jgi:hypothetical protein
VLTKSREKQMVTNVERAAIGNRETAHHGNVIGRYCN